MLTCFSSEHALGQDPDVLESETACHQANDYVQYFLRPLTFYIYYNVLPMETFDILFQACSLLLLRWNVHWQRIVVAVSCQSGFDEVLQLKLCQQLLEAAHTVYVEKSFQSLLHCAFPHGHI